MSQNPAPILNNPPATLADLQKFDGNTLTLQTIGYRLYFRLADGYKEEEAKPEPSFFKAPDDLPIATHSNLVRFAWVPRKTLRAAQTILRIKWKGHMSALYLEFENYTALFTWSEHEDVEDAVRKVGIVCYQRGMQISPAFWIAILAAANHRQDVETPKIDWINVYQNMLAPSWLRVSKLTWHDRLSDWPGIIMEHQGLELPHWQTHDTAHLAYVIWRISAYMWEPEYTVAHLYNAFNSGSPLKSTISTWLETLALAYFVLHLGRVNTTTAFLNIDPSLPYSLDTWYAQMQFHAFSIPKQAYHGIFADGILPPVRPLGTETGDFDEDNDTFEVAFDTVKAVMLDGQARHERAAANRAYLIELPDEHPFVERLKITKVAIWHGYRERAPIAGSSPNGDKEEIVVYNFIGEDKFCIYGVFLPNDMSFLEAHSGASLGTRLLLLTLAAAWRDLVVVGERVFRDPVKHAKSRARKARDLVENAARWLGMPEGDFEGTDWEALGRQYPELDQLGDNLRASEPARTFEGMYGGSGRRKYLPSPATTTPPVREPRQTLVIWGSEEEQKTIREAVKVPGGTRRLPAGHKASEDALKRAAEAFVIVPEGKSFWREHYRGSKTAADVKRVDVRRIECKGLATLLHTIRRKPR